MKPDPVFAEFTNRSVRNRITMRIPPGRQLAGGYQYAEGSSGLFGELYCSNRIDGNMSWDECNPLGR